MKKIEMIIRPEKLDILQKLLDSLGISGMTITPVMGCGTQKGNKETYRGATVPITLHHKLKVEVVLRADIVELAIKEIRKVISTNSVGDGKIFIFNVEDVVRIRTGERGKEAI